MRARIDSDTETMRRQCAEYEVCYADDSQSHAAAGVAGKPYYHHIPSGVTSWDPPPCWQENTGGHGELGLADPREPAARPQPQPQTQTQTQSRTQEEQEAETESQAAARQVKAELAAAREAERWMSRTATALEEMRQLAMDKQPQPQRCWDAEAIPSPDSATVRISFKVLESWFRGQNGTYLLLCMIPLVRHSALFCRILTVSNADRGSWNR